jgi:glycosyltransferase involved in cell wall biosynthesis
MTTIKPKISVIIACYNYAYFLIHALDSIAKQTLTAFEVLIIDDGSTDNTAKVAQKYSMTTVPQLKYHYQHNQGPGVSRNIGAKLATGEYILHLDADDTLEPDALQNLHQCQSKYACDVVIAGYRTTENNNITYKPYLPKKLKHNAEKNFLNYLFNKHPRIAAGAMLVKRTVHNRIKFADSISGNDLGFFSHLLLHHYCITLDKVVLNVTKHSTSLRNRTYSDLNEANKIADAVFDPKLVPANLQKYRRRYYAKTLLSLAIVLGTAKKYKAAVAVYNIAIRKYPRYIVNLRYLRKYIKFTLLASRML